ncbi:unnamed protein product [Caenorhabditis auriculariae]|uniref:Thioredoxin domain-containing protein n=1 Tax=Caenorhabditis auriculariae TaxID=2777116 RepID=A0A8S1HVL4_9PELO|nr:unnamed protein product [Caenorhabditis auriculariae]
MPKKMTFLSGTQLERFDKTKVEADEALAGKVIALYFSAHWCPPCRQFTPILKDFYGDVEDDVEVVFVSLDRSEDDLKSYMKECHGDWYHIPFGSPKIKDISAKYGVSGIPALIIVKADGTEITKNGRSDVQGGKSPKAVVTAVIYWPTDDQIVCVVLVKRRLHPHTYRSKANTLLLFLTVVLALNESLPMLPELENSEENDETSSRTFSTKSCPTSLQSSISRRASNTRRSLKELGDDVSRSIVGKKNAMQRIEEDPAPSRPSRLAHVSYASSSVSTEDDVEHATPLAPRDVPTTSPLSVTTTRSWSQSVEKIENALHRNYYVIAYSIVIVAYLVGFAEYLYFRLVSLIVPKHTIHYSPCQKDERIGKDGFHYGVSIAAFIAIAIFQILCFFGLTISEKWTVCKQNPRESQEAAQRCEFAAFLRELIGKTMYRVFLCYGMCSLVNCAIIFYMVAIQDSLGDTMSTILLYVFDAVVIVYFAAFPLTTVVYHPHIHCLRRRSSPARFILPPLDPKTRSSTIETNISATDALRPATDEPAQVFSRQDPRRHHIDRRVDINVPVLEEYLQSPRRHVPPPRTSTIV